MSSSQPRRLQAFAAGLLLAVIVVGTPLLLARIVGWPLPREVPDIGRVRTALGQGDIPAQTVVSGLAVIVWVIWLQIAWATAWELLVNARRLDRGERPSTGPFVMPWVHSNVARLVAVAFSATVVATATAAPVLATRCASARSHRRTGRRSRLGLSDGRPVSGTVGRCRDDLGRSRR